MSTNCVRTHIDGTHPGGLREGGVHASHSLSLTKLFSSSTSLLLDSHDAATTCRMLPQDMPTSMLTVRGHLIPSRAGVSSSMHFFRRPCFSHVDRIMKDKKKRRGDKVFSVTHTQAAACIYVGNTPHMIVNARKYRDWGHSRPPAPIKKIQT